MVKLQLLLLSNLVLVSLPSLVSSAGSFSWGYAPDNGPSVWPDEYEDCGGQSNSPIDILDSDTEGKALGSLEFTGYGTPPAGATMTVKNNGHTVQVDVADGYSVNGGGLPAEYKLAQFHWHWGNTSDEGSEHTLNSESYAAEFHFVHFDNGRFADISAAVDQDQGLAVVGIFMELSASDNAAIDPVIDALVNVSYKDETYALPSVFALDTLFPDNVDEYYRYEGGLTSPPCYESVVWTVMKNPVTISERQLDRLRTLRENAEGETDVLMVQNFRPPQALNGRVVYMNDMSVDDAAVSIQPFLTMLVLSLIAAILSS